MQFLIQGTSSSIKRFKRIKTFINHLGYYPIVVDIVLAVPFSYEKDEIIQKLLEDFRDIIKLIQTLPQHFKIFSFY